MRRSVCGLMLVLTLVSCTRWTVNDQPLPQLLPKDGPRPSSLRIRTYRQGWSAVAVGGLIAMIGFKNSFDR